MACTSCTLYPSLCIRVAIPNSEFRIPNFPVYTASVTWAFAFLLIFLGGFTLSLVTGFARRLLHPTDLCDHVVVPSHEHLHSLRFPAADLLASFLMVFGLISLTVYGLTKAAPSHAIGAGAFAGVIGIFVLRSWLCRVRDPCENLAASSQEIKVVREIPANGYGQVEVTLAGNQLKLAARTEAGKAIPVGAVVDILQSTESVVVVRPSKSQPAP